MKRIPFTLAVVALVVGSLITYPAHMPWMVLLWLAVSLIAGVRGKPMWPWLVTCVLISAIKRPGFTPEFWGLLVLFSLAAGVDWWAARKSPEKNVRTRLAISALVLLAATGNYGVTRWLAANASRQFMADNRPIACLGDSLTAAGYPQELAKLISVPVADFGADGIKTDHGIKMIPDILARNPQVVVMELGGHDYNTGKTRAATKANLAVLIEAFRERDIQVVLVEIPRGFISDPYDGLERELAAEHDLQLVHDSVVRNFVYNSPIMPPGMLLDPSRRYSDDGLHPNKLGNKYFARVVCQSLVSVLGESIRLRVTD